MGTTSSTATAHLHDDPSPKGIPTDPIEGLRSSNEAIDLATKYFSQGNSERCLYCVQKCATLVSQSPLDYMKVEGLLQMVARSIDDTQRGENHSIMFRLCILESAVQNLKQDPIATSADGIDAGVVLFIEYLQRQVHTEGAQGMKRLMELDDDGEATSVAATTITSLGALYSKVGELLHEYVTSTAEKFGALAANSVLSSLCQQVTTHATAMLEFFVESYNLTDIMQQLQGVVAQPQAPRPDPLQLDALLQAMVLMCSYSLRFINFVSSKAIAPYTLDTGQLVGQVKILLGYYLGLEEQYMLGAVAAAVMQNNITDDCLSTCVDDGFFVLRKCSRRALSSLDTNTACAVITAGHAALENPYLTTYSNRFVEASAASNYDVLVVALNDIALSVEYIGKLKRDLEAEAAHLYPGDSDKKKIMACLVDLVSTTSCTALLTTYIGWYANSITPAVDQFLLSYEAVYYEFDVVAYEQAEINDPFMSKFTESLDSIFSPISAKLSKPNVIAIADHIAQHVALQVELACTRKKYTVLGAVQFAKDVRMLSDYFVGICSKDLQLQNYALRHKFSRLGQMAQLLNLDRVIDVMEYWVEGKSVFKFTPDEVQKVLAKRVDFSREAIAMLKLS